VLIPDLLYRPTNRDLADPSAQFDSGYISDQQAAATIFGTLTTVPAGRALILMAGAITAIPDAAQSPMRGGLRVRAPTGGNEIPITGMQRILSGNGYSLFSQLSGHVWIPPMWALVYRVIFTGALANTVEASYVGFLVPATSSVRP
jgi:hypothetical protein